MTAPSGEHPQGVGGCGVSLMNHCKPKQCSPMQCEIQSNTHANATQSNAMQYNTIQRKQCKEPNPRNLGTQRTKDAEPKQRFEESRAGGCECHRSFSQINPTSPLGVGGLTRSFFPLPKIIFPSGRGTLALPSLRFFWGVRERSGRPRLPKMAPSGPPMLQDGLQDASR